MAALLLVVTSSPLGGANAASPKAGGKCTKLNQKVKVSKQNFQCSRSGKKLVWVKIMSPAPTPRKTVTPKSSKSPSPTPTSSPSQTTSSPETVISETLSNLPSLPSPTPTPTASEAKNPTSTSSTAASSEPASSNSNAPSFSPRNPESSPSPSPSPSRTGPAVPQAVSNVLEKNPVSLSSPYISGIKNGAAPSTGQVLTCSGWKWDQQVPQTMVSWIAYPSNTGSDIIDPNLYTTLSAAEAINDSKLEISASNIGKIAGNYLYCFVTAKTAGGLETTSIAALLLGK